MCTQNVIVHNGPDCPRWGGHGGHEGRCEGGVDLEGIERLGHKLWGAHVLQEGGERQFDLC